MFGIGYAEMVVIGIVAVLLFGKRLPEVARSVGQSYQQFRQGLNDIQNSITTDSYQSSDPINEDYTDEYEEEMPDSPRFIPPANDD